MRHRRQSVVAAGFLLVSTLSRAGMLSNEPPADFLNLETCGGYSKYSCTLKEFSKSAFPSNFSQSWAKDGNGNWVLILNGVDVASGTKNRLTFTFEKVQNGKGIFANPIRINSNGDDVAEALIPNLYIPMVKKAGQATGRMWRNTGNGKKSAEELVSEKFQKAEDDELRKLKEGNAARMQLIRQEQADMEKKQDEALPKAISALYGKYRDKFGNPDTLLEVAPGAPNTVRLKFMVPGCNSIEKDLVSPTAAENPGNLLSLNGSFMEEDCKFDVSANVAPTETTIQLNAFVCNAKPCKPGSRLDLHEYLKQ